MPTQPVAQIKPADPKADPMTMPKARKGRKSKLTVNDLPQGTAAKFGPTFIPLIRAYLGILPAWAEPEIPIFKRHWNNVYGRPVVCGWEKEDPVRMLVCIFAL